MKLLLHSLRNRCRRSNIYKKNRFSFLRNMLCDEGTFCLREVPVRTAFRNRIFLCKHTVYSRIITTPPQVLELRYTHLSSCIHALLLLPPAVSASLSVKTSILLCRSNRVLHHEPSAFVTLTAGASALACKSPSLQLG